MKFMKEFLEGFLVLKKYLKNSASIFFRNSSRNLQIGSSKKFLGNSPRIVGKIPEGNFQRNFSTNSLLENLEKFPVESLDEFLLESL